MIEVGIRFPAREKICDGPDECRQRNPVFELGRIYEAVVETDKPMDESMVYEAVQAVRREYPSISINYIMIDGNRMVVQMFDPQAEALFPTAVVAVLLLIIGVLVAGEFFIERLTVLVSVAGREMERMRWFWYAVGAGAAAAGAAALVYAVKPRS